MKLRFDHAVVVVPDLESAAASFRDAGFVVTPGGRHDAIPTANALIPFEDGSYLELLAFRDSESGESLRVRSARPGWPAELRRGPAIARRFLPLLLGPPGVADWALGAERLERLAGELRRRGVVATGPVPMARERQDGVPIEWSLLLIAERRLPFLIEDRTPREWRVPAGAATAHPNRAHGISRVTLRAVRLPETVLLYMDLFGAGASAESDGSATLALAGSELRLETGEPEGARAVSLDGVGELPEAVTALGVRAAQV